jgi:hypothetical protein
MNIVYNKLTLELTTSVKIYDSLNIGYLNVVEVFLMINLVEY